jgi:hypothetical protein
MNALFSLLRAGIKPAGPGPWGEKGCVGGARVCVEVAGDVGSILGAMEGSTEGAAEGSAEGVEEDADAGCVGGSAGLWGWAQFSSRESSRGMPSNTSWVANVRSSAACTVRQSKVS